MTELQIDKKDLIEQPELIVLQQAVVLCESKNIEKVRRSVLKDLAMNNLTKLQMVIELLSVEALNIT
jgi:hypothetical protein